MCFVSSVDNNPNNIGVYGRERASEFLGVLRDVVLLFSKRILDAIANAGIYI